eukprot:g2325.t1
MKVVIISGTHSGSGSTTVSISLMRNLREQGLRVQGFKFGPDFIENNLLETATGRMAVNLVPWTVPRDCLISCLSRYATVCDIAIIDGSAGLFDRHQEANEWSTAELARCLSVPVVLIVDAIAMGQSCAALVKGFENFDKKVRVAGVILNKVNDFEHASVIEKALCKDGVKAEFLGWIPYDEELLIINHHSENQHRRGQNDQQYLQQLLTLGQNLKTEKLIEVSTSAKVPKVQELEIRRLGPETVKIAVAKDAAFSFYYHENFMMLESAGAELVFFSPLKDTELPEGISAIYLGGGHPELHVRELSKNISLVASIRAFAESGGVVYAEGGGLSYLSKTIEYENELPPCCLVGVFPFRTVMLEESPSHGNVSVTVEILNNCPLFPPGTQAKGYICHKSQIRQENVLCPWEGSQVKDDQSEFDCVYRLFREESGYGSANEGYCKDSVIGSYVHLQFASDRKMAPAFIKKCQEVNLVNIKEAVNYALMNVSIQIVKNGGTTPRLLTKTTSYKSPRTPGLSQGRKLKSSRSWNHSLQAPASDHQRQTNNTHRDSTSIPTHSRTPPSTSIKRSDSFQQNQSPDNPGFHSERASTFAYSCKEVQINPLSDSERVQKSQKDCLNDEKLDKTQWIQFGKRELRKSFSLDDVGFASQSGKTHFGNKKIVGLSSTGVEMICALGLDQRLIGITNLCKYPENIQIGRRVVATTKFEASQLDDSRLELKLKDFWCRQESAFVLDEEYLRTEQPSLVIVEEGGDPGREIVEQLFKTRKGSFTGLCTVTAPTKILVHKCLRLSEVLQFMLQIARAAGIEDTAAIVVDKLRARIAQIGTLIATDFPVERVVVLTCLNPLTIGGNWIPEMVTLAGGECIGAKAGHPHQRVSWLELKNLEPEMMILAGASWEETKEELAQLASLPGWWGMPAMKTGQLYVCDPRLFTMAGPRLIDGIELLARILHPSLAGQYGKQGMAWSCTLRAGKRCRPFQLYRQFCTLL